MENCKKCGSALPETANFCPHCGKPVQPIRGKKKRGNGQGCITQMPNGKYKVRVTIRYFTDEEGKRHRESRCQTFVRKTDAVAAVSKLLASGSRESKPRLTFGELYEKWLPTHKAGKSTIDGYKAAYKYFAPIKDMLMADIDIDDLQECIDECPHGKRTRENMKALAGLVYKYGIPRHAIPENLNLAPFLSVSGDRSAHRESFNDIQIEQIRKACGTVPGAEEIYCMIYLGFRPSEYLALKCADYDATRNCLVGGAKTAAGKGRAVTLSPKIKTIVAARAARGGLFPLIADRNGKQWPLKKFTEELFYPALEAVGIDNPIVEIAGGKKRHKYTPHSCRHTFATLLKRVAGADKDKQELIGHASPEMLRYYQDAPVVDLEKITNAI